MKADNQPPTLACHLDRANYQERTSRWTSLNRAYLLETLPVELGVDMIYSPGASDELCELVRLEEECCPFLRFQLEPEPTSIKLSIRVPESARDSIDALLEPFRTT